MTAQARRLGRALKACVREDASDRIPPDVRAVLARDELGELIHLARHHRVVNFIHETLRGSPDVDPDLARSLEVQHRLQLARHLRAKADLADFGEAVAPLDVPWLVFKGPVLSDVIYRRPDLRVYDDLDILVPPSAFPACIRALEQAGRDLLDRNWELIRKERRAQLHLILGLGTLADVHWHLLNRDTVRRSFSLSTEELFERARMVRLDGMEVRTLDPVDTLLHLCLHAALSGGQRLLWLKDIDRAIAADQPAWDDVVRRARDWGAATSAAIILERARRVVGAEVPEDVLAALRPSRLKRRVNEVLDVVWPPELSHERLTPTVLLSQIARDRPWTSVAALVHRLPRRPLRYLLDRRMERSEPDLPPPIMRPSRVATESGYLGAIEEQPGDGGSRAP